MLSFIRKQILNQRQAAIKKRYPDVNIILHKEMPSPSASKMTEVARLVNEVNAWEDRISRLSDEELRMKTADFKERISKKSQDYSGQLDDLRQALSSAAIAEEKDAVKEKLKNTRNRIFEDVLPEAFAVVREASKRTTSMRHFDVQIAGGIILHEGKIAEMATGEGKTLVATLPAYLNALLGKGVHIVTVNDYLARRDREWMGPIYEFLGLSVGVIQHEMSDEQRKAAYSCDITYGTNNEFGFDYLRDNMKYELEDLTQRDYHYAIVDEVDSILIDEARTPLIISGPAEESTDKYYIVDKLIGRLKGRVILEKDEIDAKYRGEDLSRGFDYMIDEKAHTAHLTEDGERKVCSMLNIPNLHEIETMEWRHHVIQALRAHNLYKKDVDYVIKEGEVIIVDEFTGRMMPGRRWSDGLHQAVEAREGLKIERENQTLATITFQNYFRMYEKLAGMTGTAFTEASEFKAIYKLDVTVIPTNRPLIRANYSDCVYKTEKEKLEAVVKEIIELDAGGRPVLVGTISIEKSERISDMLKRRGIPHQVLNAKYHELEAQIVAQAGRYKGVTIATNMAGRGTDILLGGNPEFLARSVLKQRMLQDKKEGLSVDEAAYQQEYKNTLEKHKQEAAEEHRKVVEAGGLHVLGTERHEARRIDNQLRGRCGRQGDPGSSRFYVSFQDDLMRLFAPEWMLKFLDNIDTQGEPLTLKEGKMASMVSKSIETAQRRVEQHNFEIRKQLLEYDNVMNKQREVIYGERRQILEGVSLRGDVLGATQRISDALVDEFLSSADRKDEDVQALAAAVKLKFGLDIDTSGLKEKEKSVVKEDLSLILTGAYEEKEKSLDPSLMRHLERMVFLQIIDTKWKEHLYAMDYLREGIGLRAYGQRDPLIEYKREAFEMFSQMISGIEEEAAESIFRMHEAKLERFKGVFSSLAQQFHHPESAKFQAPQAHEQQIDEQVSETEPAPTSANKSTYAKVGRNDPCPCGSGKKYKKCHGK